MSTYLSLNVHLIFATKHRTPSIANEWRAEFHGYLGGTARGLGASALAVGGVADHVHLLLALKATHAVSDLVREIKKASQAWASGYDPYFAWQTGYAALSIGNADLQLARRYVENQEQHHARLSSGDELKQILAEFGIEYDERYFE